MGRSRDRECRVYVGNLPRDIRTSEVEDFFYKYGKIRDIKVVHNRNGGHPYAFVEFYDSRDAEDAIRGRDGYSLDGSRVRVEFCNGGRDRYSDRERGSRSGGRGGPPRYNAPPKRSSYRLHVSNLPTSGSWQDLKDHMRQAGDVLFADVYRDGTAVVEFARSEDLKYALDNLQGSTFRSHENETSVITLENGMKSRSQSPRSRSISRSYSNSVSKSRSRSRSEERASKRKSKSNDSRKRSYSESSRSMSRSPLRKSRDHSSSRHSSKRSSPPKERSRSKSMSVDN